MNLLKNFTSTLLHYKISTLFNIIGLSIAFAIAYIAFTQVLYDFNFNKGIKDSERTFRVENNYFGKFGINISSPLAKTIYENNPFVEVAGSTGFSIGNASIVSNKNQDNPYNVTSIDFTENMLYIFGVEIIEGDFSKWAQKTSVGISERKAKETGLKIGDIIYKSDNKEKEYYVEFIFKDFPLNCDMGGVEAVFSASFDYLKDSNDPSNWNQPLYVKLYKAEDKEAFLEQGFKNLLSKYKDEMSGEIDKSFLRCTSLRESYFTNDVDYTKTKVGNKGLMYALFGLGSIILIIAFINYFNFFMALVPQRIRGINTRKVLGASSAVLRLNLLAESIILIIISLLFAGLIIMFFKRYAS